VIYGIGIDLVHIERIRIIVGKWGQKFLKRVFTEAEISYCYTKSNPYLSLAVRFAAKEALIKAMGAEIPLSFTDIEVVRAGTRKPSFSFSERINNHFRKKNITAAHLSLSHDHEYGVASVILEQ
jgi:holo-[acyl-carrier protein] synthase